MKTINTPRFQFIADALHGAGGFRDGGYLTAYPREAVGRDPMDPDKPSKYESRRHVAWYENHLAAACARFVGYLSRRAPQRQIDGDALLRFYDNCDWRGNSLDVFWARFMFEAKARGSMLLVVDMPPAGQVERSLPYLRMAAPEDVIRYTTDTSGALSMIEICGATPETRSAIWGWDAQRWWMRDEEGEQASGVHGLGLCPVLTFSEAADFPSEGAFAQIADISRRLYNARSELDEILRGQTFSLLAYQIPADAAGLFDGDRLKAAIGTQNMLLHYGDQPAFIAPDEGPARVYLDYINALRMAINEIAMVSGVQERAESGVALTLRFQALNSSLTAFARRMEDFERQMWDVVARWLRLPQARVRCAWAKDFSIADVASELATLQTMAACGFPDTVLEAKKRAIIAAEFSNVDALELSRLMASVSQRAAPAGSQT